MLRDKALWKALVFAAMLSPGYIFVGHGAVVPLPALLAFALQGERFNAASFLLTFVATHSFLFLRSRRNLPNSTGYVGLRRALLACVAVPPIVVLSLPPLGAMLGCTSISGDAWSCPSHPVAGMLVTVVMQWSLLGYLVPLVAVAVLFATRPTR